MSQASHALLTSCSCFAARQYYLDGLLPTFQGLWHLPTDGAGFWEFHGVRDEDPALCPPAALRSHLLPGAGGRRGGQSGARLAGLCGHPGQAACPTAQCSTAWLHALDTARSVWDSLGGGLGYCTLCVGQLGWMLGTQHTVCGTACLDAWDIAHFVWDSLLRCFGHSTLCVGQLRWIFWTQHTLRGTA